MKQPQHTPVLVPAIITSFAPKPSDTLLDTTLGLGGHAAAYLEASTPSGRVVGLDTDPQSLQLARQNLAVYGDRVTYRQGNFANLKDSLTGGGILAQANAQATGDSSFSSIPSAYSHILFDLGVSSFQIADAGLGLSFSHEGPLRMMYTTSDNLPPSSVDALNRLTKRLNRYPDVPDMIEHLNVQEITQIIKLYGEERYAGRIAKAIKESMPQTPAQLAETAASVLSRNSRLHPATRTFQAFRIAVNRELEALAQALPQAGQLLRPGGKLAVISFHSLEDRIVKNFIREGPLTKENKKPITPSADEIRQNPRSRSAKLRIAVKPMTP